jgi:hypothetical protein
MAWSVRIGQGQLISLSDFMHLRVSITQRLAGFLFRWPMACPYKWRTCSLCPMGLACSGAVLTRKPSGHSFVCVDARDITPFVCPLVPLTITHPLSLAATAILPSSALPRIRLDQDSSLNSQYFSSSLNDNVQEHLMITRPLPSATEDNGHQIRAITSLHKIIRR